MACSFGIWLSRFQRARGEVAGLVQNLKRFNCGAKAMDESYGQFCTVARGAEALCERWTPLVVRELLCGSKRFNELHRGVPRMSTNLLAQRCGIWKKSASCAARPPAKSGNTA
jgi:Predicted transcriptional regulators